MRRFSQRPEFQHVRLDGQVSDWVSCPRCGADGQLWIAPETVMGYFACSSDECQYDSVTKEQVERLHDQLRPERSMTEERRGYWYDSFLPDAEEIVAETDWSEHSGLLMLPSDRRVFKIAWTDSQNKVGYYS